MKKIAAWLAVVFAAFLSSAGVAFATLSDEITTGITDAGVTLQGAATALVTAMLGFWTIRKVGQKLGWW